MRIPIPNNKLVAFTLIGALLTAGVAGALAMPGGGLAQIGDTSDTSDTSQQASADAPAPNENFTPAVQTQDGYEDEEHEEHEDDEDDDDEDEEHEEHEDDEDDHDDDE